MADEIGPALTRLLANPPSGFVALRGEKTSAVWPIWTAKPFLPNAVCELRGDETGPKQELHCTINNKAPEDVTTAWYKSTASAIDKTVRQLQHGGSYVRNKEVSKNADAFQGLSTVWVYDGGAEKIEIELTDDRNFGFASNTLSVRYLKRVPAL